MDDNFLILYFTEDVQPVVRVLSETSLGPEIEMGKIAYFKNNHLHLVKDSLHFHIFKTVGFTTDPLIFKDISTHSCYCVTSGISARTMFKNMEDDPDYICWLYNKQITSIINQAMLEKQHCNVH